VLKNVAEIKFVEELIIREIGGACIFLSRKRELFYREMRVCVFPG
jgi:hypothetical protein